MAYTSEQYKYKLMRLMQRNFHMTSEADRRYTMAFYGKLFEGVTVTEESYNDFVNQMRDEMDYCRKNNIYACENLPNDVINEHGLILAESFKAIGIDLVIDTETDTATFTKPSGEVMVYAVSSGKNYFYINAGYGLETQYGKASAPYFTLENMEVIGLDQYEYRLAGNGTIWEYEAGTQTLWIKGEGYFQGVTTEEQVIGGSFDTVVIGSGVRSISSSVIPAAKVTKVVLLHPSDSSIKFPVNYNDVCSLFSYSSDATYVIDIYTDVESLKDNTMPTAITIRWHSLDEWEG